MARPRNTTADPPPVAPFSTTGETPPNPAPLDEASAANEEREQIKLEAYQRGYTQGTLDTEEIRNAAFEEGVAEGLRRAAAKQLPLFETAKQLIPKAESEQHLRDLVDELQDDREERLSRSDQDLILAGYRRHRAIEKQRETARAQPGLPHRTPPTTATSPPRQTEYETVQ